jgi:hypothetical protein
LSVRKACDQLEDAISAVRQGLSRIARATAAPASMHRLGDGEGGSSSASLSGVTRLAR